MKNKFGSIIAIEPSSGEILSLVNSPSFNPNLLIGRNRSINYIKLKNDSIGKPLFDRGLQGQYPPGSPFKLVNGLIGLQENIINNKKTTTHITLLTYDWVWTTGLYHFIHYFSYISN